MNQRGFTLLEMLLAMAIFSAMSLGAWQMFAGLTLARQGVMNQQKVLATLDQSLLTIDQDFRQIAHYAGGTGPVFGFEDVIESDDEAFGFVRYGWHNPQYRLPRSNLQRVMYRLKENRLERMFHLMLTPLDANQEPVVQTVMENVKSLKFRFFIKDEWFDGMPDAKVFPQGVAILIEVEGFGVIERRFLLSDPWTVNL